MLLVSFSDRNLKSVIGHWKKKDDPCYKVVVPNLLAPGTGFVEDNFSMDRGWGRVAQAVM